MRRWLSTTSKHFSHENPLGLPPRKATNRPPPSPPTIPRISRGLPPKRPIPNVSKVLAVSSAKGGVGKSTIAVNLALSFTRHGLRTGILDTDIFGPSIPTLLNLVPKDGQDDKSTTADVGGNSFEPRLTSDNRLIPLQSYGLHSMSMGYLLPSESAPVAWRGLMVMKALQQLLHEVDWTSGQTGGGLDVLVMDLPPGTGDVQLTIGQQVVVDGAVVVSTPQDVAMKDAVKGVAMFKSMGIEVLGLVQNMSVFVCPGCGEETRIFAHNPGRHTTGSEARSNSSSWEVEAKAKEMGVGFLGDIPLDAQICYDADRGMPTIVSEEANGKKVNTIYYEKIAEQIASKIGLTWK